MPEVYEFKRGLGQIPDYSRPDYVQYATRLGAAVPDTWDLLAECPNRFQEVVEDQLSTNSCVGNAVGSAFEFHWAAQTGSWADFSRLMIYWWARAVQGWQGQDGGCMIYDAMEQASIQGVCLSSYHPFVNTAGQFNTFTAPDSHAIEQALRHQALGARKVHRLQAYDAVAAGHPVVFGFSVFEHRVYGPEAVRTGTILRPAHYNDFAGGHAMLIAGYDKSRGRVWGPNSWGTNWGRDSRHQPGWFEMDMEYIHDPNLSSDFWILDGVEEVAA